MSTDHEDFEHVFVLTAEFMSLSLFRFKVVHGASMLETLFLILQQILLTTRGQAAEYLLTS